jgi:hypothetical protein
MITIHVIIGICYLLHGHAAMVYTVTNSSGGYVHLVKQPIVAPSTAMVEYSPCNI